MEFSATSLIQRITAINLYRTFDYTAKLVRDYLHSRGYIHARSRQLPYADVGYALPQQQYWDPSILSNKRMADDDPNNFLLNATRQYVEIPNFPYVPNFFSVPDYEVSTIVNIVLTRFHLIALSSDEYSRVNTMHCDPKDLKDLYARQSLYYRNLADVDSSYEIDTSDIFFEDVSDYDDTPVDKMEIAARIVQCGSYIVSDVVPIVSQVSTLHESLTAALVADGNVRQAACFLNVNSRTSIEIIRSPLRCKSDIAICHGLRKKIFAMVCPDNDLLYADHLLSISTATSSTMSNTVSWTLVHEASFFLAPKGSGKSTFTRRLQARKIGVFEDEQLMKLVPSHLKQNVSSHIDDWRVAIESDFLFLVLMALARGDHILWSVSNFHWYSSRHKWLKGIRTIIIDTSVIFPHRNQSDAQLVAKRERDMKLITTFMRDGYLVRRARSLSGALHWDDTRTFLQWLSGDGGDPNDTNTSPTLM